MSIDLILYIALILAAFLCSLVAGFLFAFAVIVIPGIGNLNNREFIRSFQAMDGVIQRNQPLFMLVWVGSVLSLVVAAALGFLQFGGAELLILIAAAIVYLFCVQLPTLAINVPLNNRLQSIDVYAVDDPGLEESRKKFESRWIFWNAFRTVCACLTSLMLIVLLIMI